MQDAGEIVGVHMDFETSSAAHLGKSSGKKKSVGAWAYAEHPTTLVLCLCWKYRYSCGRYSGPKQYRVDEPNKLADLKELAKRIDNGLPVHAWNAFFEMCIWNMVLAPEFNFGLIDTGQIIDTMTQSLLFSGPADLDTAGKVYSVDVVKDMEGKKSMEVLAKPQGKKGLLPITTELLDPVVEYCHRDVGSEIGVFEKLPPIPPLELARAQNTVRINCRGIELDLDAIRKAKAMAEAEANRLGKIFETRYGLAASQNAKLLEWVKARDPGWQNGLNKTDVALNQEHREVPAEVCEMLQARSQISQTSLSKLDAMLRTVSLDGRARGVMEFAGAAQTRRDAGRLFQALNLPRVSIDLDTENDLTAMPRLIKAIRTGRIEEVRRFGDPRAAISTGLRGMLKPAEGKRFVVADLASIEAVFGAAIAGERWKIEAFKQYIAGTGPDLYCKAASSMFGFEVTSKKEFPVERGIGKVSELAFQFGGVVGAWRRFDPTDQRTDKEIKEFSRLWRAGHPGIVAIWGGLEAAAKSAILNPGKVYRYASVRYKFKDGVLACQLPSGGMIYYHGAGLGSQTMPWTTDDGDPVYNTNIYYYRRDPMTNQWAKTWTYGPKIFENVVQAGCRDLMMNWHDRVAEKLDIVLRVYDELAAEVEAEHAEWAAEQMKALLPLDEPWLNNIRLADGSTIAVPLAASVDILECYQK